MSHIYSPSIPRLIEKNIGSVTLIQYSIRGLFFKTVVLSVAILCVGCTGILDTGPVSGRRDSQQTYYTSDLHHEMYLKEDMKLMDISVKALQTLAGDNTILDEERHARVLRELDTLKSTAEIIESGQEIFSYTTVSPYMGSFLFDLAVAREHAQRTPPDYRPATWLVKSCLYCHDNI